MNVTSHARLPKAKLVLVVTRSNFFPLHQKVEYPPFLSVRPCKLQQTFLSMQWYMLFWMKKEKSKNMKVLSTKKGFSQEYVQNKRAGGGGLSVLRLKVTFCVLNLPKEGGGSDLRKIHSNLRFLNLGFINQFPGQNFLRLAHHGQHPQELLSKRYNYNRQHGKCFGGDNSIKDNTHLLTSVPSPCYSEDHSNLNM